MNSIQERITKYIENKGITPYKFCKDLGFSMGYLDKRGAIGTDKYLKIIEYYPEINPEWLLTGKGEMLKDYQTINERLSVLNKQEQKLLNLELSGLKSENKLLSEANYLLKEISKELKFRINTLEQEIEQLKKEKPVKSGSAVVKPKP